jgi:hypothetical protein
MFDFKPNDTRFKTWVYMGLIFVVTVLTLYFLDRWGILSL